ncbi:hypothetical protein CSO01_32730 [Cellulomonas soli]|uniref:Uncharacterized protein n=1 Tax=Cellulomonas soli TaxID=931535 RepID=A0A512PH65_9CELL|nr:hypothetical protein CSO01_32730 [Cellulomonas soli]
MDLAGRQWPKVLSCDTDAYVVSTSSDVLMRAAAGVRLAATLDLDNASDTLLSLLHDPENTFVTQETAEALVGRRDHQGLRLLLRAYADADELSGYYIRDAIVWPPAEVDYPEVAPEMDERRSLLDDLAHDPDAEVAKAARLLLTALAGGTI